MQKRYHIIYITMIALVFTLFISAFIFTPMVPKVSDSSVIDVHLTAAYDNVVSDVPTFLIGDKLNIFQQIYQKSIPSLLISLLIVIFGIVLIIYWFFLARRFDIGKSLLYLGFFSALMDMPSLMIHWTLT